MGRTEEVRAAGRPGGGTYSEDVRVGYLSQQPMMLNHNIKSCTYKESVLSLSHLAFENPLTSRRIVPIHTAGY